MREKEWTHLCPQTARKYNHQIDKADVLLHAEKATAKNCKMKLRTCICIAAVFFYLQFDSWCHSWHSDRVSLFLRDHRCMRNYYL